MKGSTIYDSKGNPVSPATKLKNNVPSKKATGLFGSIYSYPNYGKYRPRFYTLSDSSQGLDSLSRELLVRWSREMYSQLPFIGAAVNALSEFAIGEAYLPEYHGQNVEWWKQAEEWLRESFYPNCNVKGHTFDFQTCLNLESKLLDVDGDYLCVFGRENGFPKFQIIQNNRVRSTNENGLGVIKDGPFKGCILSDGVYYLPNGKAVGYRVHNATNLVTEYTTPDKDLDYSSRDAHLIFDPRFIDKSRGVPSIGSAILQALSIQELDGYLMEKIKIQSTVALVEKTPDGQAPMEFQNTLDALENEAANFGIFNPAPNTHALQIIQGSNIRYVYSEGGDIVPLSTNGPSNEAADYMARLETQILSTLGVPHQLIYSTDKVTGRITTGVVQMFRAAINRRQKIMDKQAKFRIAWALSVAMEQGYISENTTENLFHVIGVTHPTEFSLDAKYDNQIVIDNFNNGLSTFNDATQKLFNRSAEETINEQKQEQIDFYKAAQDVAKETGMDVNIVISGWKQNVTIPPQAPTGFDNRPNTDASNEVQ